MARRDPAARKKEAVVRHRRFDAPTFALMPYPTIGDEPWQRIAVQEAMDLYSEDGLRASAAIVARSSRWAADYLKQFPALIVVLHRDASQHGNETRQRIHDETKRLLGPGGRLKDIVAEAGLAMPLRALHGRAVTPWCKAALRALARHVSASALAQSIPTDWRDQQNWLFVIHSWMGLSGRRIKEPAFLLDWLAPALAAAPFETWAHWHEALDFALAHRDEFNRRWTWEGVLARATEWHRDLARRNAAATFLAEHGIGFEDEIAYTGFPIEAEVDGYLFTALCSGAALHEEGAVMRHCVATYAGLVLRGMSRIYSITSDGERVATVELSRWGGKWVVSQIKARFNEPPPQPARIAAAQFAERFAPPGPAQRPRVRPITIRGATLHLGGDQADIPASMLEITPGAEP